jgi:hypothetical protein
MDDKYITPFSGAAASGGRKVLPSTPMPKTQADRTDERPSSAKSQQRQLRAAKSFSDVAHTALKRSHTSEPGKMQFRSSAARHKAEMEAKQVREGCKRFQLGYVAATQPHLQAMLAFYSAHWLTKACANMISAPNS